LEHTAYFDNAATTFPKPEAVYQFLDSFYRECGVNVGRGQHKLAAKAAALVADTRKRLLELNHCPAHSVVFRPSATEALNITLHGVIDRDNLNIYLTPFEHNAVVRPINHIAQTFRLNIYTLVFNKGESRYDIDAIRAQFAKNKPDIVIASHASNVCGAIVPFREIFSLSKRYGAVNVVDMCQTMGLIDTDISSEVIDYTVFAAHKMLYGSLGLGGFICKSNSYLPPLLYGGTGVDSASLLMPDALPDRFEAGSQNIHAIAGLYAALNWIKETGIEVIYEKERENHHRLLDIFKKHDNISVVGGMEESIGVISCRFDGYSADDIGRFLSERNIAVRSGLHCAPGAHRFLGTFPAGTVRFSAGYFNDNVDFEQLEEVLNFIHANS